VGFKGVNAPLALIAQLSEVVAAVAASWRWGHVAGRSSSGRCAAALSTAQAAPGASGVGTATVTSHERSEAHAS
jgi:hypothetical protein